MIKNRKLLLSTSAVILLSGLYSGCSSVEATKSGGVNANIASISSQPAASEVSTQAALNTSVDSVRETNGWYNVNIGNTTGLMASQFVTVPKLVEKTGMVVGNNVNLRSSPELSAKVVTKLAGNLKVTIVGQSGDWFNVKTATGVTGWVSKDFISNGITVASRGNQAVPKATAPETPKPADPEAQTASETGQKVVEYAKKFLGVSYVYGGTSPKGFDCSGYTSYVYKNFGVKLDRVAADQAKQGKYVDKASLKPGDMVFFDTNGGHNYICHVGIYIGGGSFIHASSGRSAQRVVITDLNSEFYVNSYMTARRVID